MTAIALALCAIAVALLALAINVGRLVDALRMPRPRATSPQDAPARSDGYPPPPDSTDAFYVPPGRTE